MRLSEKVEFIIAQKIKQLCRKAERGLIRFCQVRNVFGIWSDTAHRPGLGLRLRTSFCRRSKRISSKSVTTMREKVRSLKSADVQVSIQRDLC